MRPALRICDTEKWSVWITVVTVVRTTSVFVENRLEHANDMVELRARREDRNQYHNLVSSWQQTSISVMTLPRELGG